MIIFFAWLTILFMVFSVLLLDFYTFYQKNIKIKEALNRSIKAAALQIDTEISDSGGNNLAGMGIFLVNDTDAYPTFEDILKANIGLDDNLSPLDVSVLRTPISVLEFEILNDYENMPYEYHSPTLNDDYLVQNPGVFAVCSFEVQSYFIKKQITFGKLASAELVNTAE